MERKKKKEMKKRVKKNLEKKHIKKNKNNGLANNLVGHNVRSLHPNILIGLHFSLSLNRQFGKLFYTALNVKSLMR